MSIKTKKRLLEEDFLSDQQEKALTADQVAGTPENTEADDDFADLLGTPESEPAPAEPEAGSEEAKTEENLTDNVSALKDVINGLAVTVQKLTDKVDNMAAPKAEEAPAEGGEGASEEAPADLDLNLDSSADAGQDEQPDEGGEGGEQAAEPNTEDKPAEGGEGGEQSSEESQGQDESAPGDEQKTEAYRMNKKSGKLLNSNSGSIIGIVESGKLYKLDEQLMTVVKAKIRQRIEEAKKTLKAELLGEEVEKVAEPAQDCGNEKQIDEKKESMSFLEKIKAAKAAKDCDKKDCDKDEKCDESKKCSDKFSSEVEEDEDGKKKEH